MTKKKKKKPCGVTSANSSRRKLVREGVSCRHFYLGPHWVMRAGEEPIWDPWESQDSNPGEPVPKPQVQSRDTEVGVTEVWFSRENSEFRRRIWNGVSHNCFKNWWQVRLGTFCIYLKLRIRKVIHWGIICDSIKFKGIKCPSFKELVEETKRQPHNGVLGSHKKQWGKTIKSDTQWSPDTRFNGKKSKVCYFSGGKEWKVLIYVSTGKTNHRQIKMAANGRRREQGGEERDWRLHIYIHTHTPII